jgi:zinc transport system substrate-binding protein
MKTFIRPFMLLPALLLTFSILLSACGGSKIELAEDKINVVTSFYPLYDFAQKIGGSHVHVINAVPSGVEPHDWAPKSRDITQINKANLFVYQGAGFEGWVHELLESKKKDAKVVVVEASVGMDLIPVEHSGEEHKENAKDKHGHEDESEFDPHSWLSPANAKKMAENVKKGLVQADPAHQADYESNYKELLDQLDQLDRKFKDSLAKVARKEIVVSHEAFAYLCRDYGLTQKAIMGLAPDSEPTARDMKEINDFIKQNHVKYIFFEELVSDKLAKTLANDAKIETLVLNPLEGLTDEQAEAGEDYFTVMEKNLQNLVKALQ